MTVTLAPARPIIYPDSDGLPMAENTLQYEWIVTIKGGVDAVFADNPAVFVAGDLFWYPVEGHPEIRTAPDTMAVFGRPKGHRGSYRQWEEEGIAPQVVFEVLSPGNRPMEMMRKFDFYQRYGVEEYYLYDPDLGDLSGWIRESISAPLREIPVMHGHVSPRLGVHFDLADGQLQLTGPDGRRFASYQELIEQRKRAEQRAEALQQRAERLADQLRALGQEPIA